MPALCLVTASLDTLTGGNAAYGSIIFSLSNFPVGTVPQVIGIGEFPATTIIAQADEQGNISINLWGNDNINPGNTQYLLTFRDSNRNEVGQVAYVINGTSFNINVATPATSTPPAVMLNVGNIYRIQPVLGTPLVVGDFALSGWGAGATITNIVGTDTAFQITVTAGTGPVVSPTITLGFHDGPWILAPSAQPAMVDGSGSFTWIASSTTTGQLVLTFKGLPVATKTYVINAIVWGSSVTGPTGGAPVGSSGIVRSLSLLGNTTAISGTIFIPVLAGVYRLTSNLIVTGIGTGNVRASFTYSNGSAVNVLMGSTAGTAVLGAEATNTFDFYSIAGQPINYSTAYTPTGIYSALFRLEYLG